MNVSDRFEFVKNKKLCFNCLNLHNVSQCKSNFKCSHCNRKHNSLLHFFPNHEENAQSSTANDLKRKQNNKNDLSANSESLQSAAPIEPNLSLSVSGGGKTKNILLSTAEIYVINSCGQNICVRAILDSGSQINLMTAECASVLGIKKEKINTVISGISGSPYVIKNKNNATISNREGSFTRKLEFLIVSKITDMIPATKLDISELNLPESIQIADRRCFSPHSIQMLIGSELFFEILKSERIRTGDGKLLLQNTVFGYLVTGTLPSSKSQQFCGLVNENENLDKSLQRFFEVESFPGDCDKLIKTEEERYCEDHFVKTYSRDESGRYVLEMPIKNNDPSVLGDSRETATRRLNAILKRLDKNKTMADLYTAFMKEYLDLGHMEEIRENSYPTASYYIPHHAIFRPESSTTPLRVVFDASAKTNNGYSLNSILLNGGNIQQDLFSIMTRFRTHRYAFTADVEKMYRQILIKPSQRDLQRILWQESKDAPMKTYQLRTVTYGTACAPFMAMRVLQALTEDEGTDFPMAATTLRRDAYMDDILSGGETIPETRSLQSELIQLLERGGMKLHKWVSNSRELYEGVQTNENYSFQFQTDLTPVSVKALGMRWTPTSDCFSFNVSIPEKDNYTKRDVLSQIARLFDPLGIVGPIVTKAKIFLQRLWLLKLQWHEELPANVLTEWKELLHQLLEINQLNIKRYVLVPEATNIQIHGFSDASQNAYGAAIYLRSRSSEGQIISNLLCSKSKVSPIKTLTIPRLELVAALLLARLVKKIIPILHKPIADIHLWTDSTIVLAWLKTPPHKLKTFVNHRVAEIQTLTKDCQWRHVSSSNNPADIASRGMNAGDLLLNSLWWNGPSFLLEDITNAACVPELSGSEEQKYKTELKNSIDVILSVNDFHFINSIFDITNDYVKLIKILSFIFRFVLNCKTKSKRVSGPIMVSELQKATNFLVRSIQNVEFPKEVKALKKNLQVSQESKLKFLHPFLDENNILRVGGRLINSNLEFDNKHQIILPKGHRFTKLIFEHFHRKYFHIGPQGLLHYVRMQFWPINGKNLARKVVHECITCFKNKPITANQIMGNLPSERVKQNFPFFHTGTDFCGPFEVKYKNQRRGIFQKIYVAIFVCLVTKAIHIELVTDLTSEAFIAALKRFFARRGKSASLTSDNATNFKGANSELNRLKNLLQKPDESVANFLVSESVDWRFIPPRSPNFGGLWEAGVKSFKYFLKRTLRGSRLTIEEFQTITAQIEGILNSRPITPLSADINDFQALTPGHFLIGRPINAILEPQLIDVTDTRLSRWQRVTKFVQIIWKNWHLNYLSHLQNRSRWQFQKDNIKPGTMVIIKEENLPPCKWRLGRILEIIPGKDGCVRVARVKTASNTFLRPISKLCILPIEVN